MSRALNLSAAVLAVIAGAPAGVSQTNPYTVSNVKATHSSGQTFITWDEVTASIPDARYYVYRSADMDFGAAERLEIVPGQPLELPTDSGEFYADRVHNGSDYVPRHVERLWIPDGAGGVTEVESGEGVFVWTLHSGEEGSYHYAVTSIDALDVESAIGDTDLSAGETVAEPMPVELAQTQDGCPSTLTSVHVFIQYMDARKWNVTLHAPNPRNEHYDEDNLSEYRITRGLQYAYTYEVSYPDPNEGCSVPLEGYPLTVRLHGHNRKGTPKAKCQFPGKPGKASACGVEIRPYDVGNTWWFGSAMKFDFRKLGQPLNFPPPGAGERIVNFTEKRILRMIYDLSRHPTLDAIDPNRVYIRGHSMGGSGALSFATRYPNVFAAAHAGKGVTDYQGMMNLEPDHGIPGCPLIIAVECQFCPPPQETFMTEYQQLWGDSCETDISGPIKVLIDLPAFSLPFGSGWGDPVLGYSNDYTVWQWQDHQTQMAGNAPRVYDDMVPVGIAHGYLDDLIVYCNQVYPVYPLFNQGHRCLGMSYDPSSHTPPATQSRGMPVTLTMQDETPFYGLTVVKNETVPGFSDPQFPPMKPPCGTLNNEKSFFTDIEWRATWNDDPAWGEDPKDKTAEWQMYFRTTSASQIVVDITPRRVRVFPIDPDTDYLWENFENGGATPIQSVQLSTSPNPPTLLVLDSVILNATSEHRIRLTKL